MADLPEHQPAGRARVRKGRISSSSQRRKYFSRTSTRRSESSSVEGIPQRNSADHGRRRPERLQALQGEASRQKSRQGRQQALQTARRRAKSVTFPNAQTVQTCIPPRRRKRENRTKTGPKNSRKVQPMGTVISHAAAASSKAERNAVLAHKRMESQPASAQLPAASAPACNTREQTAAQRAQQRDVADSMDDAGASTSPTHARQKDSDTIDRAKRQRSKVSLWPGSDAATPCTSEQVDSDKGISPRTPPQEESHRRLATLRDNSPESPPSAAAEQPAPRHGTPSVQAAPVFPASLLATGGSPVFIGGKNGIASASEHQVATDVAGRASGQANGQANNMVAGQIGQAVMGAGGQASGQSETGQQEHGNASNRMRRNEQSQAESQRKQSRARKKWLERRPLRSKITQRGEEIAGCPWKLGVRKCAHRLLAYRSVLRGYVQGGKPMASSEEGEAQRVKDKGEEQRVEFKGHGCSSLSILTRQNDTTSTPLQARKAALYVHKVLRERSGEGPAPENDLYRTFAEASEQCQGVRNPLEDWSHQMETVTLSTAAHTSIGIPVFVGLDDQFD